VRKANVLAVLMASLLLGLSPLAAAEPVIQRGIDAFTTPADGSTFYDFAKNPIPAGFFCADSRPFTGRVAFKGLPLATGSPEQLPGVDTVVERLDDGVFNAKGTATTRIQFRALSMVSIAPIETSCGAFHAYVALGGPQRVTMMSIHRTTENGGTFVAPLAVDVRLTFVPVDSVSRQAARKLELPVGFTFPPRSMPWGFATGTAKASGSVIVDTNGDLTPDTRLPGPSNFTTGQVDLWGERVSCCLQCHEAEGHLHCFQPSPCNELCGPIE